MWKNYQQFQNEEAAENDQEMGVEFEQSQAASPPQGTFTFGQAEPSATQAPRHVAPHAGNLIGTTGQSIGSIDGSPEYLIGGRNPFDRYRRDLQQSGFGSDFTCSQVPPSRPQDNNPGPTPPPFHGQASDSATSMPQKYFHDHCLEAKGSPLLPW